MIKKTNMSFYRVELSITLFIFRSLESQAVYMPII